MDFSDLGSDEIELIGRWSVEGGHVVADQTCKRIEWLVSQRLERVATSPDGWDVLFRDARDGRLWERIFTKSEMHGGGPPALLLLTQKAADLKYFRHGDSIG